MAIQDRLSLRGAAEMLELEPLRVYRLGRYFRLAPGDPCIPRAVVVCACATADREMRYRVILDWLLAQANETDLTLLAGHRPISSEHP